MAAILLCCAHSRAQQPSAFDGRLFRSISEWGPPNPLTAGDRLAVPAALRTRFDRFEDGDVLIAACWTTESISSSGSSGKYPDFQYRRRPDGTAASNIV